MKNQRLEQCLAAGLFSAQVTCVEKSPAAFAYLEKNARALIGKPRIVFADEPTGNLDTRTGEDTMKLLTECAAEFGQTLIVVTHNPEIAKKAQQIIRIEDGCILKEL